MTENNVQEVKRTIEYACGFDSAALKIDENREAARNAVTDLVSLLESGEVRAARKGDNGIWKANQWVKEGILLGMKTGEEVDMGYGATYKDKDLFPPQEPNSIEDVRVVPGGTAIRGGAYLEGDNIVMPPTYVNVGAYVGRGTMLDSDSLVGSCAQVGRDAHISGRIGGVLEPAQASPCVVEDNAFMGINTSISEGTVVKEGAVLAPGVNLTSGTPIYDREEREYIGKIDGKTYVPENAVVISGSREIDPERGIGMNIGIIAKYKDSNTEAATAINEALR